MTIDNTMSTTDNITIIGVLTKIFWKPIELYAIYPIPIVTRSCKVTNVYTLRINPERADDYNDED